MLGLTAGVFVAAILSLGLMFVFLRGSVPALTRAEYEAALERWERNELADYDLEVAVSGTLEGTVHVEVRDGAVTAMTRDGRSPSRRTWDYWSVPGLFEVMETDLKRAEKSGGLTLRAQFDPEFGYPSEYHRGESGSTSESRWTITRFIQR